MLEEYFGDVCVFIDFVVDQGIEGLEFVDGNVSYMFDVNWKFQFENGFDYYYFVLMYSLYIDVFKKCEVWRGLLEVKLWNLIEIDFDV